MSNRQEARKLQRKKEFFKLVSKRLDLSDEKTEHVTKTFLDYLVRRISYEEAAQMLAQLPEKIREELEELPAGPDTFITANTIMRDLEIIGATEGLDGEHIARECWAALREYWKDEPGHGETSDIHAQLPQDLKKILSKAS